MSAGSNGRRSATTTERTPAAPHTPAITTSATLTRTAGLAAGVCQQLDHTLVAHLREIAEPLAHREEVRRRDQHHDARRPPAGAAEPSPPGRPERPGPPARRPGPRPAQGGDRGPAGGHAVVDDHRHLPGTSRGGRPARYTAVRRRISSCWRATSRADVVLADARASRSGPASRTSTPSATAPSPSSGLPGAPTLRGMTTSSGASSSARHRRRRPRRRPSGWPARRSCPAAVRSDAASTAASHGREAVAAGGPSPRDSSIWLRLESARRDGRGGLARAEACSGDGR